MDAGGIDMLVRLIVDGQVRSEPTDGRRWISDALDQRLCHARVVERNLPCQEPIEHHPEGKDIGPVID